MPTLSIYRGDQLLQQLPMGEGVLKIGRAPENDLVLPDVDKGVSRSHAEIRFERGQYVVADLNSQNGVWLGSRRVRVEPLPPGVPLTIGPYRLVVEGDASTTGTGTDEPPLSSAENPDDVPETILDSTAATSLGLPPAPSAPTSRRPMLVYGGAALALIVSAAIIVVATRKATVQPDPQPQPPSRPIAKVDTRAELEQHLARANEFIAAGDQAGARRENDEALKLAPGDKPAADQRAVIDAMPEAPALPPQETDKAPDGDPDAPPGDSRGGPPLPVTLRVVRRPGESNAQRQARQKLAQDDLRDGLQALRDGRFAEAKSSLEATITASGRPEFGNIAFEARNGVQKATEALARIEDEQLRRRAQQMVEEAQALAAANNLVAAVRRLQEARTAYPEIGFAELLNEWGQRARVQGESTLRDARNYGTFKRNDQALALFERAVGLLELVPGGHPDLAEARRRVQELKGGR